MAEMMTIKTSVTLHVPADDHAPFKIDPGTGAHLEGKYSIREVPPGMPVKLNADEAKLIIKRFGGEVVEERSEEPKTPLTPPAPAGKTGPAKLPDGK